MSDAVSVQVEGPVGTMVIDHPPANAISGAVIEGLRQGLSTLEAQADVRVVVITGAGSRFFAAGADISEFPTAREGGAPASGGQELTLALEASRLVTIAAVNGIAFGGGCEIALACDLRVASTAARFGQPEIKLGIIPGWGGTQRLPRIVGTGRALPLLFSGDPVDAQTALAMGLVSQVVQAGELAEAVRTLALSIAAQAPLALAATKRAVVEGAGLPLRDALAVEEREFRALFGTEDAREGIGAFLEKRAPTWRGR